MLRLAQEQYGPLFVHRCLTSMHGGTRWVSLCFPYVPPPASLHPHEIPNTPAARWDPARAGSRAYSENASKYQMIYLNTASHPRPRQRRI